MQYSEQFTCMNESILYDVVCNSLTFLLVVEVYFIIVFLLEEAYPPFCSWILLQTSRIPLSIEFKIKISYDQIMRLLMTHYPMSCKFFDHI